MTSSQAAEAGPTPATGADAAPGPADPRLGRPNTDFVQRWQPTMTSKLLRELLALAEQVAPVIARRADLSHTELRALEMLVEAPQGPVELAHRLGVTSAASSGVVDRLAGRGHVQREPHATDGRRTVVRVTDSGREEVLGYLMPMFTALAALDAGLEDAERAVIERYLRAAIAAIRRVL